MEIVVCWFFLVLHPHRAWKVAHCPSLILVFAIPFALNSTTPCLTFVNELADGHKSNQIGTLCSRGCWFSVVCVADGPASAVLPTGALWAGGACHAALPKGERGAPSLAVSALCALPMAPLQQFSP